MKSPPVRPLACIVAGALLSAAACGPEPAPSEAIETTESNSQSLAIPTGTTLWNNGKISICWRFPGVVEADRALVRQFSYSSWTAIADVDIFGWDNCFPVNGVENRQGRLGAHVFAGSPQSMSGCSIGSTGGSSPAGQMFNVAYPTSNNSITAALVNHEFGHCLGFMHEFERNDWPAGSCIAKGAGAASDNLGTPANDTASVMVATYCHNNPGLSAWDVIGVQRSYGPRRVNNNAALVYVNQSVYRDFPATAQHIHYFQNDSSGTRLRKWNGSSWSWSTLGQVGSTTVGLPSVTTYRDPQGTRYIHAFTRNSNDTLGLHWMAGTTWNKNGLPGVVLSDPSATSFTLPDSGNIEVDVFYRTTNGDLGHTAYNGSQWLVFNHGLSGKMVDAPSAVTVTDGASVRKFHVFYRGTDNKLRLRQYDGTNWAEVGALTSVATMASAPDAHVSVLGDSLSTRRYDVFWVSSSGELHDTTSSNGTTWTDVNLGNQFPLLQQKVSSAIAYDKDGVQRQWIVGRGTSNNIVMHHWNGASWTAFTFAAPSGVTLTDIPQIEAHETAAFDRRINIFAKAGTALYSLSWDGTSWAWNNHGSP